MQPAHFRNRDDAASTGELYTAWNRRILVQCQVRPRLVIIIDERLEVLEETALVEHDHVIVFSARCLCRHLQRFTDYYHRSRTHLALAKASPEPRRIQAPDAGRIIAIRQVGGLHHRYERRAA
jgi:hypothetical protein